MFDLDIVQRSVFIDNTRSPPPLLGNWGSGSPQNFGELVCIVKCLVNLIQQLKFNNIPRCQQNSGMNENCVRL